MDKDSRISVFWLCPSKQDDILNSRVLSISPLQRSLASGNNLGKHLRFQCQRFLFDMRRFTKPVFTHVDHQFRCFSTYLPPKSTQNWFWQAEIPWCPWFWRFPCWWNRPVASHSIAHSTWRIVHLDSWDPPMFFSNARLAMGPLSFPAAKAVESDETNSM